MPVTRYSRRYARNGPRERPSNSVPDLSNFHLAAKAAEGHRHWTAGYGSALDVSRRLVS